MFSIYTYNIYIYPSHSRFPQETKVPSLSLRKGEMQLHTTESKGTTNSSQPTYTHNVAQYSMMQCTMLFNFQPSEVPLGGGLGSL